MINEAPQSEIKGLKFIIGTVVLLVAIAAAIIGFWVGKAQAKTYYVSSSGTIHNELCRYYKAFAKYDNCKYCGGR